MICLCCTNITKFCRTHNLNRFYVGCTAQIGPYDTKWGRMAIYFVFRVNRPFSCYFFRIRGRTRRRKMAPICCWRSVSHSSDPIILPPPQFDSQLAPIRLLSRVARFVLVQYTKSGEQNIPNDYKITNCLLNIQRL
jgi:hypothetical protein